MTTELAPSAPQPPAEAPAALRVEDLSLSYVVRGIRRPVLRGVSFDVKAGESYGLVGESGCGKSTTAYAALRYLPRNAVITGGRILVGGEDITGMDDEQVRKFRMHHASMVYQDPGAALNPTTKAGPQVAEAFAILGQSSEQARESALAALRRVHIADPEQVYERYPYQLSGGMQQRIVIAIALACSPKLLVLDEPTTGLDATVEASVLDLVRSLMAEMDAAVLLIAHNLGVIRTMCDRVGVMYAGKIVEEGNAVPVFERPQHPYTVGLLQSLPRHGITKSERPLATIPGTLPQIGTPLPTCVYVDRCPLATDLCREVGPPGRRCRQRPVDALPPLGPHRRDQGAGGRRSPGRDPPWRCGPEPRTRLQDIPRVRPCCPGRRRHRPAAPRRRDARARRRIGVGQVDGGQDHPWRRESRCRQPGRAR